MHIKTIWRERPLDTIILVFLTYFIFGWLSNDVPLIFGIETSGMAFYTSNIDPLQANAPKYFTFIFGLASFVYGPSYLVIFYGLLKNKSWLWKIALPISGMVVGTTLVHMYGDITSETPPLNMAAFVLLNGPFVLGFLLLIFRCVREEHSPQSSA